MIARLVRTMKGLPSYLYNNGERFWLTISADIQGKWNAGYCNVEGEWLKEPKIGLQPSIEIAINKLEILYGQRIKSS